MTQTQLELTEMLKNSSDLDSDLPAGRNTTSGTPPPTHTHTHTHTQTQTHTHKSFCS